MSKIAGVVLAAGASRRLGEPKQTVVLAGETLVERAIRVAAEAGLDPVFVIAAEDADWRQNLARCSVLLNQNPGEGMAASIRIGIAAAQQAGMEGVVVMACDQPAVTHEHLQKLMAGQNAVVASEYAGRRGVPAYFPAAVFHQLLSLSGDAGARDLLRGACAILLPQGELDIDTAEDLERAKLQFG